MLKWDSKYLIGIPIIDEQHEKLVDIANEASEILSLPEHTDKYDDIITILNELKDYTAFHFSTEENLMKEIRYPKFFSHQVEHNDFITKVNGIDLYALDEDQDRQLLEIIRFVTDWIITHILEKDTQLASYYNTFKAD
jgi:hemerythrin